MFSGDSPKILINRLSALGDCVLTIPMLCALRKRFPNAEIAWITQPLQSQLLQEHPDLDHTIVVEKSWLKSPAKLFQVRRQLRAFNFDVSIDVQGLTKSSVASWLSAAPIRISFSRGEARELAPLLANCHVVPTQGYAAAKYLELLKPLGIETEKLEYRLPVDDQATTSVRDHLHTAGVNGSYVVINPGAGWFSKTWSTDRFAQVSQHIWKNYGMKSVVTWGNYQENTWAQAIVAQAGGAAVLSSQLSIAELKELIRNATLFVGNDTGPLHFAVALDTATVSLFGVTKAEFYSPNNQLHRTVQAVYHPLSSRQRRKADNSAMLKNSVALVRDQVNDLLDNALPERKVA